MTTIQEIKNSQDLYPLRHEVLWQHKPESECGIEPDTLETTFHIGALDEKSTIIGTSTFILETNPAIEAEKQYRLRAMATHPSSRGSGLGKEMIRKAMGMLKEKGIEVLWCDARLKASGFYKNLGFKTKGDVYQVPEIGPHYLMYIKLKDN